MSEHPNAVRYREVAAAMEAGDLARLTDYIADDVVWWQIGSDEPVRGKEAVVATMQEMQDVDLSVRLHDVLANDEHLIALVNATARRGDDVFEYRTAEIHHVDADGRLTERWAFSDDTAAIIDFFG